MEFGCWTDNVVAFSRRQWETLGVQHLSYNSTVEVGGYFFQPRAISHNHDGFIAAADWFRRIHEEAENDDDTEETTDGGEQSADTHTTLPALDPDHATTRHLSST